MSKSSPEQFHCVIIGTVILFSLFGNRLLSAARIELESAPSFVVAMPGFFIAAVIMLFIAHVF
jgi:hypothetical protein